MKKNKLHIRNIFLLVLVSIVILFKISESSMLNYCSVPPFLTTAVSPNILFVIDKSGSMSWAAYYRTWSSTNNISEIGTYNPDTIYEGYFIPDRIYKNVSGIWKETSDSENCTIHRNTIYTGYGGDYNYYTYYWVEGTCSGNKLNFARMTRIDLLRWAVTGGRPTGCGSFTDKDCDPDLKCIGNTCVLETHPMYKSNWNWTEEYVEVPKWRINGILQIFEKEENRPRFGALFYSSGIYSDKIYIGDYPNGNDADPDHPYTYLKRAINYVDPGGGTGTAPAMWEAYDYFKQSNDHYYSNGFSLREGTYKDPNYFCDYRRQNCKPVPCAKNFVILASDGQWNYGGGGPNWTCSIQTGIRKLLS
ncbi:MAG: VWA domain-containing protein [Persephonella sp.]|nr:VWA domain-containing protein [Persephonella sp.]